MVSHKPCGIAQSAYVSEEAVVLGQRREEGQERQREEYQW